MAGRLQYPFFCGNAQEVTLKIALLALANGLLPSVSAFAQSSSASGATEHRIYGLAWIGLAAMAALAAVVLKNHIFETGAPSRLRAFRRRDSTEQ